MKRNLVPFFLFVFLLNFFLAAESLFCQEMAPAVERILNPLPEYDPFEKAPPPPQFFPDEVDKRVRELLIDALTQKGDKLEEHLRFFAEKDGALKKERGTVTGLTEYARDLLNNSIRERERYLEAQKKALASATTPERKQLIEARLNNDDLSRANELLRQAAVNRWGALLNRILSSADLASILSGSYAGAAVETTLSQLFGLGSREMSIEERKALALMLEHLRRYPDDPKNGEVQKAVEALEKKKKSALVQREIDKAAEARDKGDLEKALFHYREAAFIDPLSPEAKSGPEEAKRRLREEEEERKKGLLIASRSDQQGELPEQDRRLTSLLYALPLGDSMEIEGHGKILEQRAKGTPLVATAKDVQAVALEIRGQHEEAKKILREIAGSSSSPHERQRASALLASPEYNLLDSFEQARSQHRLQTVKFVLLGDDFLKKNLLLGAAPMVAFGPGGATSLAAANVLMIGSNLLEVLTSNPISYEPVVEKGVAYIRNHPNSPSASDVYAVLSEAYESTGMYNKAIDYLVMSGKVSEAKITELKDKAAQSLLKAADRSGDRSVKESYLKAILDDYPETPAAKEATKKIADLAKIENQGLRVSKQFLVENPDLYGVQGLRLKPSLFDGNPNNMELDARGINLLSNRELLLHFKTPWGTRSRNYSIDKETTERFQMALRKKNYEMALEDLNTRPKGSPGGIKNLPLSLLTGEPDKKGKGEEETTFTLIREAGAPRRSYERVLDYELLSENEKDPTKKFKLPPIQGSVSSSRVDLSGSLPAGLWGDRLMFGNDERSPFAGVRLPIPLLQGFVPIDFLLQARPGRFSVYPRIHTTRDEGQDRELYR